MYKIYRNILFTCSFYGILLQTCAGMPPADLRSQGLSYTRADYVSQSQRIKLFRLAASVGDQESMFYLSACYDRGDIERDGTLLPEQYQEESFFWLHRSVWREDNLNIRTDWENEEIRNRAIYALAEKYYHAVGTKRDLGMANFLMTKLYEFERSKETISSLGYKAAYYRFKMSLNGEGIPQNRAIAESILQEMIGWNNTNNGELSCIIGQCNQLLGRFNDAITAYEQAIEREYIKAHCFLGWCYEQGVGVQTNLCTAKINYEVGIRADDEVKALSCCLLAHFYEQQNGNDEEIFELYRNASEVEIFPEIDFYMGWIYEHGLYSKGQDLPTAQKWYEKSIRKGFAGGYFSLAKVLENQIPIIESRERILRLYRISEEREIMRGLFHHGQVETHAEEKIRYFRICQAQLEHTMLTDLFIPYLQWMDKNNELTPEEVSTVSIFARSLTELDRNSLNTRFEELLQKERENGPSESIFFMYKELSSLGTPAALCRLGTWYLEGIYVQKNIRKAFEYFERAADLRSANYAEAQYQLGMLYEAGIGCEINLEKAKTLYKQAGEQGHIYAKGALNRLQSDGCLVQ